MKKKMIRLFLQLPYKYSKKLYEKNEIDNFCALASQINKNTISFYKKIALEKKLFFDNAILEKKDVSPEEYIELINEIQPLYAILPDSFCNLKQTIKLHEKFYKKINMHTNIIAVLAADPNTTKEEVFYFLDFCKSTLKVEYIAIPYSYPIENKRFKIHGNRISLIECIRKHNTFHYKKKFKIHLLGIENYSDFLLPKIYPEIISIDTTYLFSNAYNHNSHKCNFFKFKNGLNKEYNKLNKNILFNVIDQISQFRELGFYI